MSESGQEKTEAPTPKKHKEARDEGKIPRTQELSAAIVLLEAWRKQLERDHAAAQQKVGVKKSLVLGRPV